MKRILWLAALLASTMGAAGGSCGPAPFQPPAPDVCDAPVDFTPTAIDIGPELLAQDGPWADGQIVNYTIGGQGLDMLVVTLRLHGSSPPTCVAQTTIVTNAAGMTAGEVVQPLTTYAVADDARVTHPLYVVMSGPEPFFGERIFVTVTVGATTATRSMWVNHVGFDAAPAPDSGF